MMTVYFKNSRGHIVRHTLDVVAYYCDWRRAWVAYDANEEGEENALSGEGETRSEAIENLIEAWENRQ